MSVRRTTIALTALWVVSLPRVAAADGAQDQRDFKAANERALSGDYAGAAALYEGLISRGVTSPDVYFNLGNTYAESKRYVDAIIALEQARLYAPQDQDIRTNLEEIRKQLERGEASQPVPQLIDTVGELVGGLSTLMFSRAILISNALLFLLLFLRRRISRPGLRGALLAGIVLAGVSVATCSAVVGAKLWVQSDQRAVTLKTMDMKEGPHPRFKPKSKSFAGDALRVLDEDSGWLLVLRADGTSGWLPEDAVRRLLIP